MKYNDFLDAYVQEATRTYLDGLERAGLEPNPTLTNAVAERAIRAANAAYRERYPWRARLTDPDFLFPPASVLFVLAAAEASILSLVRDHDPLWALLYALIGVVFVVLALIVRRKRT